MDVRPYHRQYPAITQQLFDEKVLARHPIQMRRDDLEFDEGVDVIYPLKSLSPAKFAKYADALLLAAYTEAERYGDEKYKFAKFTVKLNRNARGRREDISARRDYIASTHTDPHTLVYGREVPEDFAKRVFLYQKIEDIIKIPETESPGAYVIKQRPYKVIALIVCIRAGLRRHPRQPEKKPGYEKLLEEARAETPTRKQLKSGR